MKLHWGTGIVLSFVAFIGFILYFVVLASTDEKANHDLVTDRYYEKELAYQDEIDASTNARNLKTKVTLKPVAEGMLINFPETWDPAELKGEVSFYRPSDRRLDFETPIQLSGSRMLIPSDRLVEGRWDVSIRWSFREKSYLHKERISYVKR